MLFRVATITVFIILLASLIASSGAAEQDTDTFMSTQNDYTYSGLTIGVRNIFETFARNIGRQLFTDHETSNTANILDYSATSTLLAPQMDREGFWVGAPSVVDNTNNTYIFYRLRDPFRRGWKVAVAKKEGEKLKTVWEMTKYNYKDVRSLEGAALAKIDDRYSLFLSYQEDKTGKWSINHLKAEKPSKFNFSQSKKLDLEFKDYPHFKDPLIYEDKLIVHVASKNFLKLTNIVAELPFNGTVREIHVGSDDYSGNRITSITKINDTELVFFDHKKNIVFTGEEKSRVGILSNPGYVEVLDNLSLTSNHSTRSLRYVKALKKGNKVKFYYESALPGKGHELRESEIELSQFFKRTGFVETG